MYVPSYFAYSLFYCWVEYLITKIYTLSLWYLLHNFISGRRQLNIYSSMAKILLCFKKYFLNKFGLFLMNFHSCFLLEELGSIKMWSKKLSVNWKVWCSHVRLRLCDFLLVWWKSCNFSDIKQSYVTLIEKIIILWPFMKFILRSLKKFLLMASIQLMPLEIKQFYDTHEN